MGTSLTGLTPATTYDALIKTGDNAPIDATLKPLSDGVGTNLPMEVSTAGVNFTNQLQQGGVAVPTAAQVAAKQDTLVSGTNIKTINGTSVLGSGNIVTPTTSPSGVSGAIQFSNGSAFASDAANFFWDNTNKRLGIGTNAPSAAGHFKGSGSTSATTSLLVQNSVGDNLLRATDDGIVAVGTGATLRFIGGGSPRIRGFNDISIEDDSAVHLKGIYAGNTRLPQTVIVGANTTQNASAQLQIDSTTKGVLFPRMTTTQKNAIATPATGLQVFDSTMNATCEYNGTAWRVVSAGAQSIAASTAATTVNMSSGNVQNITLTASTTLTLSSATVGTYIMKLIQGGSGSYTVTWPAAVIWSGGTAPTLTTTVGKVDIITLVFDGTNYYGNYSLNY